MTRQAIRKSNQGPRGPRLKKNIGRKRISSLKSRAIMPLKGLGIARAKQIELTTRGAHNFQTYGCGPSGLGHFEGLNQGAIRPRRTLLQSIDSP